MSDEALRMTRFTLRFAGADVEAAYAEEHARKSVRPFRIVLAASAVLMALIYLLVFSGIMMRYVGSMKEPTAAMIVLCALLALLYALSRQPLFLRRQQTILFAVICLLSAMFILATSRLPAEVLVTRGFLGMLVHMFLIYSLAKLRFPQATMAGWLGAAAYLGYLAGANLLDGPAVGRHAAWLGLANLWGMLICYQMDGAARRGANMRPCAS